MQHFNSDGTNEMIDWLRETTVEAHVHENQNAKYWWRCLLPESEALILFRNLDANYLLRSSPNSEFGLIPRMVVNLRTTAAVFNEKQPNDESRGALCKVLRFDNMTGKLVPWYIKFQFLCIGFVELSYIGDNIARRLFLEHGKLSKLSSKMGPDQKFALPQLLGGLLADAVNTLKLSDVVGKHDHAQKLYTDSQHARPLTESETVVCMWLSDAEHIESGIAKKGKKDPKSSSQDPSWQDPSWQDRNWQGWHQNHAWSASANRWGQ